MINMVSILLQKQNKTKQQKVCETKRQSYQIDGNYKNRIKRKCEK